MYVYLGVEIRGQLSRVCSLTICGSWGLNSSQKGLWPAPLPDNPLGGPRAQLFKCIFLMCVSPCLCVHLTISGQARSVACSLFKCVTLYGHQLSPNTTVLGHYGNLKAGWRTPQVLLILAFTGAPFNPSTWETEAGRSKFKASLVYRSRDGRYGLHRETLKKNPWKLLDFQAWSFALMIGTQL